MLRGTHRLLIAIGLVGSLILPLGLLSCSPDCAAGKPRGVILLIGDGMGISQITFARRFLLEEGQRFHFESLPQTALVTTYSASNPVTDSAAAATAFAAGVKTTNKYIGVDPQGQPVRSLAERAKAAGWEIGLVTSTTVTHATPAAFYAHVQDRYAEGDRIGEQLLEMAPEVVLGGGYADLIPGKEGGKRADDRNLVKEAEAAGYTVLRFGDALPSPLPQRTLGLFGESYLTYVLDDRRLPEEYRSPSLRSLAESALERLDQGGKPYFLMIEGGRIDHAGHDFDAAGIAYETQAFDDAIAAVLEYQRKHPDVLVIVTADHATGGLAINDFADWPLLHQQKASIAWITSQVRDEHEGVERVREITGIADITEEEVESLSIRQIPTTYDANRALGTIVSRRTGITWLPKVDGLETGGHTGEDVALYAGGPGAERFQGVLDQTDIPARLAELMALPAP